MQPNLTKEEKLELKKLLQIVQDENALSGQRRIAMAKIDRIIEEGIKRTTSERRFIEFA
jgi:hypothetical protein